jgi:hypothetical protein
MGDSRPMTTPMMVDSTLFRQWIGSLMYLVNTRLDICFAVCYPRYLGITRRSCLEAHMVLDMEYREQE